MSGGYNNQEPDRNSSRSLLDPEDSSISPSLSPRRSPRRGTASNMPRFQDGDGGADDVHVHMEDDEGAYPGTRNKSVSELKKLISDELVLFQLQFKLKSERACSFLWRPDADYRQMSPITTEVWAHWLALTEDHTLIVKQEKRRIQHDKTCCKEQVRELFHFDHVTEQKWEAIFEPVQDSHAVQDTVSDSWLVSISCVSDHLACTR